MQATQSSTAPAPLDFDLDAFRRGDQQVFKSLQDGLSRGLYRWILNLGLSIEDARDIYASASIKLYYKRATMRSYDHVKHSLYVIARNEAFNCLRNQSRSRKTEQDFHYYHCQAEDLRARALALENDNQKDRLLQKIWKEIRELPYQQQKVLHLYYTENLSTAEVAHRLQLSPQTVLNHKSKGLNVIRRTFHPHLPTDSSIDRPQPYRTCFFQNQPHSGS